MDSRVLGWDDFLKGYKVGLTAVMVTEDIWQTSQESYSELFNLRFCVNDHLRDVVRVVF